MNTASGIRPADPPAIAIEGLCYAGKTTLARALARLTGAVVISEYSDMTGARHCRPGTWTMSPPRWTGSSAPNAAGLKPHGPAVPRVRRENVACFCCRAAPEASSPSPCAPTTTTTTSPSSRAKCGRRWSGLLAYGSAGTRHTRIRQGSCLVNAGDHQPSQPGMLSQPQLPLAVNLREDERPRGGVLDRAHRRPAASCARQPAPRTTCPDPGATIHGTPCPRRHPAPAVNADEP